MLIVTSLVAALFASPSLAPGAAAPVATSYASVPPMIVSISSAPNISAALVSRVLAETDALWRRSGFTFVWRRAAREVVPYARTSEAGPYLPSTLRVIIGNETRPSRDGNRPLGWIKFDDVTPEREIYLSNASVARLMASARDVVGLVDQ